MNQPVLAFDGVNDCISLGVEEHHRIDRDLTVEAWVYVAEQRSWAGILSKFVDTAEHEGGYGLLLHGKQGVYFALKSKSGVSYLLDSGVDSLPQREWHHVAGTYDGTELILYIDGEKKASMRGDGAPILYRSEGELSIGMYKDRLMRVPFQGKIARARIWRVARSQQQIKEAMAKQLEGNEQGLVGDWAIAEGAGLSVEDNGPYHLAGFIRGATWEVGEAPFAEARRPKLQAMPTRIAPRGALSQGNVASDAYQFGACTVGNQSEEIAFFVENAGDKPLTLTGSPRVSLGGAAADQFEVVKEPLSPVPVGESTMFSLRFRPTSPGVKTASVQVVSDGPFPLAFSIMGTADAPPPLPKLQLKSELSLQDGIYRFGGTSIGTKRTATFTIENNGSKPVVLTGSPAVRLVAQSGGFTLEKPPVSPVNPGGSTTFTIAYKPTSDATHLVMGYIHHDADGSPMTFAVSGRGDGVEIVLLQNQAEIPSSGSYDFGECTSGSPAKTVDFTIENQGNEPLLLTGDPKVVITGKDAGDFSLQTPPASPVPPGTKTKFSLTFAPKTSGTREAQVSIANNDPDENPYLVKVTGLSRMLVPSTGRRERLACDYYTVIYADKGIVNYRDVRYATPWRQVPSLVNVKNVKAGGTDSGPHYALTADGVVYRWSYTGGAAMPPQQIPGLSDIVAMDAGYDHALFVKADGTAWSVGTNSWGQLGIGNTNSQPTQAVRVANLTNVVAVAAGEVFSLALCGDGTVYGWGYNGEGALGTGNSANSYTPVIVAGLNRIMRICAGRNGNSRCGLAVRDDGTLWGWGTNNEGALAESSPSLRNFAVQITGVPSFQHLRAGHYVGCIFALDTVGWLWSWGTERSLRLGHDSGKKPTMLGSFTTHLDAFCGGMDFALAIGVDGKCWRWGTTGWGSASQKPVLVPDLVLEA